MVELDGDDPTTTTTTTTTTTSSSKIRDLVQFIPLREYRGRGGPHLAKDTLGEVPEQFIRYCKSRNILPAH